jgi:hypothetical protein
MWPEREVMTRSLTIAWTSWPARPDRGAREAPAPRAERATTRSGDSFSSSSAGTPARNASGTQYVSVPPSAYLTSSSVRNPGAGDALTSA